MLKKTHRAFGIAMTNATLWGLQSHIPGYVMDAPFTLAAQTIITQVAAVSVSSLPDIDKALGLKHRGITHAIWVPFLFLGAAYYQRHNPYVLALCIGACLGYFFHLFGDAFSKAGIAWFYPLQSYQTFGSGGFVVKGFRGPFLPLYEVGDKTFAFMPYVWYAIAIVFNVLLWRPQLLSVLSQWFG